MNQPDPLVLTHNYHAFYSALGAAAIIMGIATGAVVLLADDPLALPMLWLTLGSFWLVLVTIFGVIDRIRIQRETRDVRALFAGETWAVWRWSAEEWREEVEQMRVDAAQKSRWTRYAPLIGLIPALVVAGTLLLIAFSSGDDMPETMRSFIVGLAAFFFVLTLALSIVGARREQAKWQRRLAHAESVIAPWVLLGEYGVYHEVDGHMSLRKLEEVRPAAQGQEIIFYTAHSLGRAGGYQRIHYPRPIRVPAAHADEVKALISRYRDAHGL